MFMNSLIPNHVIREIERKCNELVCPDCGGRHEVRLSVADAPGMPFAVIPSFSKEGCCDGFKRNVNALVSTELTRFMSDPLPLLR